MRTKFRNSIELYQQFEEDENGIMNEAYGLTFNQSSTFVRNKNLNIRWFM